MPAGNVRAESHVGRKARHEAAVPDESTTEASCAHARESEAHVFFILGQVSVAAEVVPAAQLVVRMGLIVAIMSPTMSPLRDFGR